MKSPTRIAILFLGLAAASAVPAVAGTRDPVVNHRQHHQAARIHQGVASGALTGRETRRLAAEQRAIRAEERFYKSDGVLTRAERADLRHDQNVASRHIWMEKHDGQRRF